MKRSKIILITTCISVSFVLLLFHLSKQSVFSRPSNQQESNENQISSVQLYNLYYLTQTLYLLDDRDKQIIINKNKKNFHCQYSTKK